MRLAEPHHDHAKTRERLRKLVSFGAMTGLIPQPGVFRPFGISAMIIAKNEEEWVETSIQSLVGHVDEVVVADHGSDDATGEILRKLARAYPKRIRLLPLDREAPFPMALNSMVNHCRYQWILRFNADFVARTSGPNSIDSLLTLIQNLSRRRYFCIRLSGITLHGDLEHQFPERRDRPEHFLFTYSPWIRYRVDRQWEALRVPFFYEKLALADAYYFHMASVKPADHLIQRLYWHRWFEARNRGSAISLREYATANALREWGGSNLEEAARNYMLVEFQRCVPYSKELCGEYPELLNPALLDPPVRLVYEEGKLVDRVEQWQKRLPR